jgi:2-polyprenyl-6-hydroxyphenyl methylase/3-demethylubiquinone-9 3-methyltransferase
MSEKAFSFGKNWQRFIKGFNDERAKRAEESITEFLGKEKIQGKTFLDIGCGSGLFSYAAYNLGAKKVVSFDADPFSVKCCRYVHKMAKSPRNWEIYEGSVLDKDFLSKLGRFDIVYSWGVLHHTGDMWNAIRNSARLVAGNGLYYIAIYNEVGGPIGSRFWLKVKKLYNSSPGPGKYAMELAYMWANMGIMIARMKNPISGIKGYKADRGMSWKTDIIDWLGGYPYEFATPVEIIEFMKSNFPDFGEINIRTTNGIGNNWFLFKRHSAI